MTPGDTEASDTIRSLALASHRASRSPWRANDARHARIDKLCAPTWRRQLLATPSREAVFCTCLPSRAACGGTIADLREPRPRFAHRGCLQYRAGRELLKYSRSRWRLTDRGLCKLLRRAQSLRDRVGFNPAHDRLWFVGDLVNSGPKSLKSCDREGLATGLWCVLATRPPLVTQHEGFDGSARTTPRGCPIRRMRRAGGLDCTRPMMPSRKWAWCTRVACRSGDREIHRRMGRQALRAASYRDFLVT